jgi:ABC-type Fe3+ transport system permease subunit
MYTEELRTGSNAGLVTSPTPHNITLVHVAVRTFALLFSGHEQAQKMQGTTLLVLIHGVYFVPVAYLQLSC